MAFCSHSFSGWCEFLNKMNFFFFNGKIKFSALQEKYEQLDYSSPPIYEFWNYFNAEKIPVIASQSCWLSSAICPHQWCSGKGKSRWWNSLVFPHLVKGEDESETFSCLCTFDQISLLALCPSSFKKHSSLLVSYQLISPRLWVNQVLKHIHLMLMNGFTAFQISLCWHILKQHGAATVPLHEPLDMLASHL